MQAGTKTTPRLPSLIIRLNTMSQDHHLDRTGQDGNWPTVLYPQTDAVPPGKKPSSYKTRWGVYMVLTVMFGIMTANAGPPPTTSLEGEVARSYLEARARSQVIGSGVGMLLGTYLFAAVFLAWSTHTRRFIPGTAFCFALLSFLGQMGSMEAAEETEVQFAAMQRWADSLETANFAEEDAPPQTTEARMAWATRMAMQDMAEHLRARQEAHGIHSDTFPRAWGTAEYLANARAHPEVREYFTRYRAFIQELDSTEMTMLRDRTEFRMLQSGLRGQAFDGIRAGIQASTDSLSDELRKRSIDELAWVNAGLELHDFLVRVDPRVRLDRESGLASFARQSDHNRAVELGEQYTRLGKVLERQRQASRERLRDVRSGFGDPANARE